MRKSPFALEKIQGRTNLNFIQYSVAIAEYFLLKITKNAENIPLTKEGLRSIIMINKLRKAE